MDSESEYDKGKISTGTNVKFLRSIKKELRSPRIFVNLLCKSKRAYFIKQRWFKKASF